MSDSSFNIPHHTSSPTPISKSFTEESEMYVVKRNGDRNIVAFDKILKRIKNIGKKDPITFNPTEIKINYTTLAMKVIDQLFDGISTTKIDELSAEQCASMASTHPDYNVLAGRIVVSNHHKNVHYSFSESMNMLYNYHDIHGVHSPLVSDDLIRIVNQHTESLNALCDYNRDYLIDYFGFKTLERSYLMKINKKTVERPQHMWLRVSIGIHGDNMEKVKETYHLMSQKYFTHATPTLFNSGTPRPQLSSCFLLSLESDSIEGIYNTLKECALISKWAGGIGLHIHNVRSFGSHIRGTNGSSNGIVPMLRVFNNTAKYVDQCVKPDTYIYTTNGPIQIQQCVHEETAVYNLNGETEIIENILEHSYDGEIYNIYTETSPLPLSVTGDHPIYGLKTGTDKPEWLEVNELCVGDMVTYCVPKYVKDIPSIKWNDCYFYGLMLNSGSVSNDSVIDKIFLYEENTNIEFVEEYLRSKCVQYTKEMSYSGYYVVISWNRNIILPYRYSDFYDTHGDKHIHHRWLNLPNHKIHKIICGIMNGSNEKKPNCVEIFHKSLKYIECIRFLAIRLGLVPVSNLHNDIYSITISDIPTSSENDATDMLDNTYLYSRIIHISKNTYKGILYDLQMKEEHNYMLSHGIVHNGGGKRNGSFAIYLEPWHADIEYFLEMRKNHGDEDMKARDLFYALWVSDLFMERVKADKKWTLMCPDECPGLSDVVGDDFVRLYEKYEADGKGKKTMDARKLWFQILDAQMETGTPYLVYKDTSNKKSNQQNLGVIKSSNLCSEIIEYSDANESAVCNLASIALPAYVNVETKTYDFEKLHEVTKVVTNNLDRVIDVNYYPTEKTRRSNLRHRPIGIGVQGLADTFMMLDMAFHSEEAKALNKAIFETMYHASVEKSHEIAVERKRVLDNIRRNVGEGEDICGHMRVIYKGKENEDTVYEMVDAETGNKYLVTDRELVILDQDHCGAYSSFIGCPAHKGTLQFDMWGVKPSDRYDWDALKEGIRQFGMRNSLLMSPMPTASTSQILGYNECIEPITSNIYSRNTIAGNFIVANKYMMNDLIKLNLWNEKVKNNIISNNGSIQQIEEIPAEIRNKYKTVWELPMKHLIDMASDRGAFICQSQSLNLWLEDPNYSNLTSMHFYGWSKGLKTGIYYLRRRAKHQAQRFSIEPEKKTATKQENSGEEEGCVMCSA
jgi:ribonucleotide reductase alpha subunit